MHVGVKNAEILDVFRKWNIWWGLSKKDWPAPALSSERAQVQSMADLGWGPRFTLVWSADWQWPLSYVWHQKDSSTENRMRLLYLSVIYGPVFKNELCVSWGGQDSIVSCELRVIHWTLRALYGPIEFGEHLSLEKANSPLCIWPIITCHLPAVFLFMFKFLALLGWWFDQNIRKK